MIDNKKRTKYAKEQFHLGTYHCFMGVPARSNGKHYLAGYGWQYEKEQKDNANEKRVER